MKSNSRDDKREESHLIVTAIIALVTLYVPTIITGAIYSWSVLTLEGEYINRVIRLAIIASLLAIAIAIEVSRRKQPQPHQEGYAMAEVIIVTVLMIHTVTIIVPSSFYIPPSVFERIEFGNASVTHTYTVTISFINTGATPTSIESVLLNGVPYNDSGWAGTIKPEVTGNLTLRSVIDVGVSNTGTIIFSDDCVHVQSGYRLTAGVTVKITIHTTGGKDYDTSVTLP